jgi:hypothetical protein
MNFGEKCATVLSTQRGLGNPLLYYQPRLKTDARCNQDRKALLAKDHQKSWTHAEDRQNDPAVLSPG